MSRKRAASTAAKQRCMTIDTSTLEPGEKLLWHGKPDVRIYCERKASLGFRAGIGVLVLAVASAAFQYFQPRLIATVLFVVAAVLLYFPLRLRRIALRIEYGLTDRRAIIEVPGLLLRNRVSVPLSEVKRIDVQNANPADLLFRDYSTESENGTHFLRDGFYAIPDAFKVEQLLRSAVRSTPGQPQ
jgi:hypothetical protein